MALQLPALGSFDVLAGKIDIGGSISAIGGRVGLQTVPTLTTPFGTGGIHFASSAQLNLGGAWINDSPLSPTAEALQPLIVNGGSANVSIVDGALLFDSGSLIDVSGGARLTTAGTLTVGNAGAISLASASKASTDPSPFSLGAELRGFAFTNGGTVNLSAGRVCVAALIANCGATPDASTLVLKPDFFRSGGFANFNITANHSGLLLAPQTVLPLQQQNFIAPGSLATTPGSRALASGVSVAILSDALRQPTNLSLASRWQLVTGVSVGSAAAGPSLSLGLGSQIAADPGAHIQLTSDTRIAVAGSIAAPGGQIGVTLTNALNELEYVPTQSIWLGDASRLDVSGIAQLRPDDAGHQIGNVLSGGSVTLTAQRGAIVTTPGSAIDVSGAAARVDVPSVGADGQVTYTNRAVASGAGSVAITAADAALLSGTYRAQSGDPGHVAGGSFSLTLNGNNRYGSFPFQTTPPFPFDPRRIDIAQSVAPIVLAPGAALPAAYSGRGIISADSLPSSGFDAVSLEARALDTILGSPIVGGEIHTVGDVNLAMGRTLILDASAWVSNGGRASFAAPYLAIGQSYQPTQSSVITSALGTGNLQLNGQLIDVIGNSGLSGFANVALASSGDIRLRGVQGLASTNNSQQLVGALATPGNLTMQAQQIYPSTLTQFAINAGRGTLGALNILSAPGTAAPVLSAAGSLTMTAPQINQGGNLLAPIGALILNSPQIMLLAGSTTSTSAGGQTIPFGVSQGGFDWTYPLPDPQAVQTLVYGTDGLPVPAQRIALNGASVDVRAGATLNATGGGDLLATEFIKGVGGTIDVLSTTQRPGAFAVLPISSLSFAPIDPYYYAFSNIKPGDSVYLAGGNGLAAGTYAILPARYALLPGAFYVQPVAGFQDLSPSQRVPQNDGSVVVPGYRTSGGTSLVSSRTSGFSILPGTAVLNQATYTSTAGNSFFATQAANAGVAATRLPRDAGTVLLNASNHLALNGTLSGAPVSGGRGVAVDLTSNAITVVADAATAPAGTGVVISADALNHLGAESLLIGGVRTATSNGVTITTSAADVDIDAGAQLSAPEILLAATQRVAVNNGASVAGSGTLGHAIKEIDVTGTGSLLRVAGSGDPSIVRTGTTGASSILSIAANTIVGASAALEGSGAVSLLGNLNLRGGTLSLTSDRISLGAVPAQTPGISLSTQQIAGLGLNQLTLDSRGSVDFYGNVNLATTNFTLSAAQLRGVGVGSTLLSASGTLTLAGLAGGDPITVAPGSASLQLSAAQLLLNGGALGISGFSTTQLTGTNSVTVQGAGALGVSGDLAVKSPLLTGASGATRDINMTGNFTFTSAGMTLSPLAGEPALGADIGVTAQSVLFAGRASLQSGLLNLTATGANSNVTLADGAAIDLSGTKSHFDSVPVASRAGTLTMTSLGGSVVANSGSTVDVSSVNADSTTAGALSVSAPLGTVNLAGTLRGQGADFSADALAIGNFGLLNGSLGAAGFTGARNYRLRGEGDLVIGTAANESVSGSSVTLTADRGSVMVNGSIASHSADGGSIVLAAHNDVTVTGSLDVTPAQAGDRNGSIALQSDQGRVLVQASATLAAVGGATTAHGASEGRLLVRVPQAGLSSLLDANPNNNSVVLAGDLTRTGSIAVEGYRRYSPANGVIGNAQVNADPSNPLFADASQFMAQSAALTSGLGTVRGPTAQFAPGIELDSPGDLTLSSDWLLNNWRFSGAPGFLSLRAGGNLLVNRSLSDGFSGASGAAAFVLNATDRSWSYQLAAGADLTSANILSTQSAASLANGSGSLLMAPGTAGSSRTPATDVMIRTGTGDIDIATARDVRLGNRFSMIYTSGLASNGVTFSYTGRGTGVGLLYPTFGGNIRISAGRDVIGAAGNQLVTDWLWRVGSSSGPRPSATAWTVNFAAFAQNVGALGGGNVSVIAGRDIADLGVMLPTVGRQIGGRTPALNDVQVIGGGNALVRAGRDVAGGMIYDGQGRVDVLAGNSMGVSPTVAGLYPVIALGDASANLFARGDATLAAVVNPTLLPQGTSQNAGAAQSSFFSTYSNNSALSMRSLAGNLQLVNAVGSTGALRTQASTLIFGGEPDNSPLLRVYPGTVSLAALRGDITVDDSMTMFPSPQGNVDMLAHGSVTFKSPTNFELIESDADSTLLPSVSAPAGDASAFVTALSTTLAANSPTTNAAQPVHLTGAQPDNQLSHIAATNGDIAINAGGALSTLYFAEPARVVAGRDIVSLGMTVQNLTPADISAIIAGRDIIYPLTRDANGFINTNVLEINVDGPGTLAMQAGRNINLQTSNGISSRGNLRNPALPANGADISIQAGAHTTDYAAFITAYLQNDTDYLVDLLGYMTTQTAAAPSSVASALATFRALTPIKQAPLVEKILFAELQASGRSAAQPGPANNDFSRGYRALTTLYPGANPDQAQGQTNPYSGDISLYFSRVYTLSGGDIRLLAPGGNINAGLATPPAAFGINKPASRLGIVAQSTGSVEAVDYGNFAVNESRVFAADGGNILVWSTRGDIDAGRGAKTAISAPPPTVTVDSTGHVVVNFPAALTGSGIQTLATSPGIKPGNVDLFAPHGVVNAGDAGIVAGNLTIAATAVLGADNIKVSGVSVGVPVDAGGLGASLAGVSSTGSSASQAAAQAVGDAGKKDRTPLSDAAIGWLDVFIEGFGDETCREKDVECLKRQKH
jgi:hypothetical protein